MCRSFPDVSHILTNCVVFDKDSEVPHLPHLFKVRMFIASVIILTSSVGCVSGCSVGGGWGERMGQKTGDIALLFLITPG